MHRFWVFPLVMGIVGMAYPVLCVAETLVTVGYLVPGARWYQWNAGTHENFESNWMYGLGFGVLLGLATAWREHRRPDAVAQNGEEMATRLMSNIGWLLFYALLLIASTATLLWGVAELQWVSWPTIHSYFPGTIYLATIFVNLLAIVWAARRTAHTNDVLSPRVLWDKWRSSTRALE